MDLVEWQGKSYLKRFGIVVPEGRVASSVEEAVAVAEELPLPLVVKAQVPVGGRGKAGGVKVARSVEELRGHASEILGMRIKGHRVKQVWVEEASRVDKEMYLSFTLDRSARMDLLMFSTRGGMDIEEVAREDPEAILRIHVDPTRGLSPEAISTVVERAGLGEAGGPLSELVKRAYECYSAGDATLVEINPLVLTASGEVVALDAKVSLDDDAAFRHPEWSEFESVSEGDPREARARELGLNYVGLDGFVGIIANGAGLAMSTCDVVAQVGGAPANFLDIGGGANEDVMASALELLNGDPQVEVILVNIFGGIVRCDDVARGILKARDRIKLSVPLVVRLDGTNAPVAREMLAPHEGRDLVFEATMMSAARKAVELARSSEGS
jgi:succinyl-CoA synthetase beta subunit